MEVWEELAGPGIIDAPSGSLGPSGRASWNSSSSVFVFLISVVIRTVIARETGRPWEVRRLKFVYFLISKKYYRKFLWKSEISITLKNKINIFGSIYVLYVKPVRKLDNYL